MASPFCSSLRTSTGKRSTPGFAKKHLCDFSERHLQISSLKLEPGADARLPSRGGIQIGFVLQGEGTANGEALRKYSAFSGREEFALSSSTGMELLLVGLPIFAEQEAGADDGGGVGSDSGHSRRSGEVDLSAVETGLRGKFQFVLRDDMKLTWPQLVRARRRDALDGDGLSPTSTRRVMSQRMPLPMDGSPFGVSGPLMAGGCAGGGSAEGMRFRWLVRTRGTCDS